MSSLNMFRFAEKFNQEMRNYFPLYMNEHDKIINSSNISSINTSEFNQTQRFPRLIENNEENNDKLDDFFKEFMKNFCEMILFSSILLQEAKELESIKDFLMACNDKAQIEVFNLKDKFEDMQMEISAEKKVNFVRIFIEIGGFFKS